MPEGKGPTATGAAAARLQHLRDVLLPRYARQTDEHIAHLNRIFASASHTDHLLLLLNYGALLLSTQLDALTSYTLRLTTSRLLARARALLPLLSPGDPLVLPLSLKPPRLVAPTARALRALADLVSDYRIFVRLWGLLGIYAWGRRVALAPPADRVLRAVAVAQVAVNAVYQVLENVAYLAQHGVLRGRGLGKRGQTWMWVWSSRCWAAHVALDFGRLGWEWRLRQRRVAEERRLKVEGNAEGEAEVKIEEGEKLQMEISRWRRELLVNIAYAPLTIHWSLEAGCVNDAWVGLLGTIAGIVGVQSSWRATAA